MESRSVLIIGGGVGGYPAAIYLAKHGVSSTLIEQDKLGGTCLNRGCIPTKALLHYSKHNLDASNIINKKQEIVSRLRKGLSALLTKSKVEVIKDRAKLVAPNIVKLEKSKKTIRADNIIIATGSYQTIPKVKGFEKKQGVITSKEALSLTKLPQEIVILGAGVEGIEFAEYFNQMGVHTTVIEIEEEILPKEDRGTAASLRNILNEKGIKFYLQHRAVKWNADEGILECENIATKEIIKIKSEMIMIATGKRANTWDITPSKFGIATSNGFIITDRKLRTTLPCCYATGDVNGKWMLAHVAIHESITAAKNIINENETMDYLSVPRCIYTTPEVMFVGLSEERLKHLGIKYEKVLIPTFASGRSLIENKYQGFLKILFLPETKKLLGASMISVFSSEMAFGFAFLMQNDIPITKLEKVIFPHPTISELIHEATLYITGNSIHI